MSKKSKLERKEKKQQRKQQEVQENKVVFDVIALLKSNNMDTKPNFAKFLETYVRDIRMCIGGKVQFFPSLKYEARKVFVTFLDLASKKLRPPPLRPPATKYKPSSTPVRFQ